MSRNITFQRFGKSRHLRIESWQDMENVLRVNQAHWVATGAPTTSLNCDAKFLDLVDTDGNTRIMCSEIEDAIRWLLKCLKGRDGITARSDTLRLADINTDDEDGRRIHSAAVKILRQLSKQDTEAVTLAEVRRMKDKVGSQPVSEKGVVLPEATDKENIKQFIGDIVATLGGVPHPGGNQGVDQAQLDAFLEQVAGHLEWLAKSDLPEKSRKSDIMPLGKETLDLFGVYSRLREKIDQFFALDKLVAFDERAAARVGLADAQLQEMDLKSPGAIDEFMKSSPIAQPSGDGRFKFGGKINPLYAADVERMHEEIVPKALGKQADEMTGEQWAGVKEFFGAHQAWVDGKVGEQVEGLGIEKLESYREMKFAHAVSAMIGGSADTAIAMDNIRSVEKLVLYQWLMLDLLNNFVSFPYLYRKEARAMFEEGTLIMDGRRFNFSVKVHDRTAHTAIARTSNIFVIYAEVMPAGDAPPFCIATPVTSGSKGNLCIGKRGVFEDVNGRQSDARVVDIIENPISMSEALASPFRRVGKMTTGKIEAMTAAAEKKFDTTAESAMTVPQQGQQSKGLLAGGLLMGGGVALAAVGSAIAYMSEKLQDVTPWKIVLGIGIAVSAVLVPLAIMALSKLRKRDLSAIIEGCGWAVNARMRLTLKQGRIFTRRPRYPGVMLYS
jgi:hypothetical protein